MTIRDIITSYTASPLQFSYHSPRCSVSATGGTLYSYSTPICLFDPLTSTFILNTQKYSVTTSRHQSYLRSALSTIGACVK